MAPRVATDDTFATEVLARDGDVLVAFSTSWCEPCRMVAPVLGEISEQLDLPLVTVDTDDNPGVVDAAAIESIPTVLLYASGNIVCRIVGARPKPELLATLGAAMSGNGRGGNDLSDGTSSSPEVAD